MGQKTHPKAFRLVTTQNHLSNWYSSKFDYSSLAAEDFFIRQKIEKEFDNFFIISSIEIARGKNISLSNLNLEEVVITINSLHPRVKDMYRKLTTELLTNEKAKTILLNFRGKKGKLKELVQYLIQKKTRKLIREIQGKIQKKILVKFQFIRNTFEDSSLIAQFIGNQIKRRVPFRRVVKQTIKKVRLTGLKGIKIQVSGRLNGIDIARSEWKREGKIPLHTLRSSIQYTSHKVNTVYGIIGIKVWAFVK